MGKTNLLIDHIKSILSEASGLPSYHESGKSPKYPYLVFDISGFAHGKTLEVNLWNKGSATVLEDKADILESKLGEYRHLDENMSLMIYFETRNNVSDPKEHLKRIRLTFFMQHYERSEC